MIAVGELALEALLKCESCHRRGRWSRGKNGGWMMEDKVVIFDLVKDCTQCSALDLVLPS
jgi:hypothetical protein